MTREEISKFFSRRDKAWQHHDSTTLTADHAEDGTVESPFRGKLQGRSAIEETYTQWFESFPDARYVTEHMVVEGNTAVQFFTMTGTQKGDFCGLQPTGKKFRMRLASLFFLEDGKIAREVRVYDITAVLIQLGVLKAKPAF